MNKSNEVFTRLLNGNYNSISLYLQMLITTLIPALSFYFGFGADTFKNLSSGLSINGDSNLMLSILFYINFIIMILSLSFFIVWMSKTFNAEIKYENAVLFSYYCALPFILASATLLSNNLYLILSGLFLAIIFSVRNLYSGLHIVANIDKDKGFVFASAVLTTILVSFLVIVGFLVILITN